MAYHATATGDYFCAIMVILTPLRSPTHLTQNNPLGWGLNTGLLPIDDL
jgi:hypothetical protein